MMRLMRAIMTALKMTLRGESATPSHLRPLEDWIDAGLRQLDETVRAADALGLDVEKRNAIQLKLDGRMTDLELTLQMLRHNLVNEYPRLIRLNESQAIQVIQASNMNDQYRISRFLGDGVVLAPELTRSLEALNAHLQALPPIEFPRTSD